MTWVFIDIDGVLVPEKQFKNLVGIENFLKFDPICLQLFEDVLEAHPDVLVGITSSWRDLFPLEIVRNLFSANITSRVVGFTPLLDSEDDGISQYYRYLEIQAFLEARNSSEDTWVAINDSTLHYPSDTPMVITDPYEGFDRNAAETLEQHLSALCSQELSLVTV